MREEKVSVVEIIIASVEKEGKWTSNYTRIYTR